MGGSTYFFQVPEKTVLESFNNENTLNLNMYSFKSRRINYLSEEEKQCLYNLKGKLINSLPVMGSFCSSKCVLEDILITSICIDYRFNIEKETMAQIDGKPTMLIKHIIIEGRHYFKRGLAVILSNGIAEEKTAVSVMYAVIDYLRLITNPGYEFIFTLSRYKTLALDSSDFEKMRSFFDGKMEAKAIENYKIVVLSDIFNKENDDKFLLKATIKSKLKAIEFSFRDIGNIKRSITIDENGRIKSSVFFERKAMEEIVNFISITLNKEGHTLLEPVDSLISDFCSHVHHSMTEEGRIRLKSKIYTEINDFINEIFNEYDIKEKPGMVYITLLINSTLKLTEEAHKLELDVNDHASNYPELVNFINKHAKRKHEDKNKNVTANDGIKIMNYLIQSSLGDEEELISAFKDLKDLKKY